MTAGSRWHAGLISVALALGAAGTWLGISGGNQLEGGLACRNGSIVMQRVELVLGMSRKGLVDVSDAEWAAFLEREVTPRFPNGLTVLAASGQWRGASGSVVREPSRLLLVWVEPAADLEARIESIRSAWKTEHNQESVLRAEAPSCVAF